MTNSTERRTESRVNNLNDAEECLKTAQHSLIVDISRDGAGLLILKKLETLSGQIRLKILKPDMSNLSSFTMDADIIWVDEEYSSDYRKIGVKFLDTDENLNNHLSRAIAWLGHEECYFLRSDITQ
ncbi:MAG: PilZ domain-containing protein [Gammaproteobacteria bacterium]|nr:PilZ domain-containing protein [Gammaproteobacteria bacterium]